MIPSPPKDVVMSFRSSKRSFGWLFLSCVVATLLACASAQKGEKPITAEPDEIALREQARADSIKAVRDQEIRKAKSTASEYHNNKQYDHAIPHLTRVLELDPKNEGTDYMLADCYFRLDSLDQAVAVYRQAVSVDPENGKFHQYLG
jgi:Tfp pilus assembly protein PilF